MSFRIVCIDGQWFVSAGDELSGITLAYAGKDEAVQAVTAFKAAGDDWMRLL